jgi:glycosyltransferase involved in cell wall biosynthesis
VVAHVGAVTLLAKHDHRTGLGRYVEGLTPELSAIGWRAEVRHPSAPLPGWARRGLRALGIDLAAFWASYPLLVGPTRGDVLHLTAQTLATAIALARPWCPTVVTVHDILPHVLRSQPGLRTLRNPVDARFYNLALAGLRRADLVLAVSQYTADELVRTAIVREERVVVTPEGVDLKRFRPLRPTNGAVSDEELGGGRYLLHVGTEEPRKNLEALLDAFAIVALRHPDVHLLRVGGARAPDRRASLRARIEELGLSGRVQFLGDVPDAELPLVYGRAAICVVPSLYEGFGLPVLEAMACGVPVVCSNRASLPEVAGTGALMVEPTPPKLAEAIDRLLGSVELCAEMRERGLRRAAQFSWRRTAEVTAAAYERVRARRKPS